MLSLSKRGILALGIVMPLIAGHARAGLIIQHQGATDPATEGFTASLDGTSAMAIPNDLGRPAWHIGSGGPAYYNVPLSAADQASFASQGATLTLVERALAGPDSGLSPIALATNEIQFGNQGYAVDLSLDAKGHTVVWLSDSRTLIFGSEYVTGAHLTLADNGYHTYQLVFAPGTLGSQTADLFIDGAVGLTGYGGAKFLNNVQGLSFGTVSGGQGNFNLVELTSGISAVPEPASIMLMGLGLVVGILRVTLDRKERTA